MNVKFRLPYPIGFHLVVSLALLWLLPFQSPAQETPYTVTIEPEPPVVSEVFTVTILLPETTAREVQVREPGVANGLILESMAVTPAMSGEAGAPPGTRVLFQYRAEKSGGLRIPGTTLEIGNRKIILGPFETTVLPARDALPQTPYEWTAPRSVLQWQCFPAELRTRAYGAPKISASSAKASPGLALEAVGDQTILGIALKEGKISLPELHFGDGRVAAESRSILALPAPPEISESRAIGKFSPRLLVPERTDLTAGESLILRLEIRGKGNLPVIQPPGFRIEGPENASDPAYAVSTVSSIRAVSGAYEGMTGRELTFMPEEPGLYTLRADPFVYFDPATRRTVAVRFSPVQVRVAPAPSRFSGAGEKGNPEPFLEIYSTRKGILGEAANMALKGNAEGAAALLEGAEGAEHLYVRGLALLAAGKHEEALAALAKAERKQRYLPDLAESLALCESLLEAGVRQRDRLPEPRIFLICAAVFLAAGGMMVGLVAGAARGRPGTTNAARRLRTAGFSLAVAVIITLTIAAVSALERTRSFAVVLRENARSVPSDSASSPDGDFRGRSGLAAESSGGWTFLRFQDGISAWFRDEDLREY